jgi:hypothetical protein
MTGKRDKAYARRMARARARSMARDSSHRTARDRALATFGDFFESLDPDDTFDAEIMPSGQVRALAETWERRAE